jgi:peptide/nickel transport system ATP-binding protein
MSFPFVVELDALTIESENRTIIQNVSFAVCRGEIAGLAGESGAGKTTIALAVAGLLPETLFVRNGSVRICGQDISRLTVKERRHLLARETGFVFQDAHTALNPLQRIGDQIAERLILCGVRDKNEIRERVKRTLSEVGLNATRDILASYPHELSGGMAQRVMIAIAVIHRPALIIADEPTASLDSALSAEIADLLFALKQKTGSGLLLISHDHSLLERLSDSIYAMLGGKCALLNNPA